MPIIHSDCSGSKSEPIPSSIDWEHKRALCPICQSAGRPAIVRIFKDRDGVIVTWPHEGDI